MDPGHGRDDEGGVPPAISIVMPTFNAMAFIDETLDSLDRQHLRDFELLVCDGGSTDGTLDRIAARMGDRARIVSRRDDGVPDALNRGFAAARGRVLCWLNADDVFASRFALARVVAAFDTERCAVAVTDFAVIDGAGRIEKTLIAFSPAPRRPLSAGNVFTAGLFFTQAAWSRFGGFSGRYRLAFEYELTDFLFAEFEVLKVNTVTGCFRIHPGGLSSKHRAEMFSELRTLRNGPRQRRNAAYWVTRAGRHVADGTLLRLVANRLRDRNRGLHWSEMDDRGRA